MEHPTILNSETEYFEQHKREFIDKYRGKVLLIHDQSLIGTYPTEEEAVSEGIRRFGVGPFLVRKPEDEEHTLSIPAYSLGLL